MHILSHLPDDFPSAEVGTVLRYQLLVFSIQYQ